MSVAAAPAGRREIEAIAVIGFGHGVSHFFHLMIPPLFPWLMRDFGLSFTQAGLLAGVFFAVSGVGQAAAGFCR
jgi:MFS transporter, FSR family, fosmidomycin resistance protein